MPYIITKEERQEVELAGVGSAVPDERRRRVRARRQEVGDCWTLTNTVTRRSVRVGACKNPTPENLWGARGRRRRRRR